MRNQTGEKDPWENLCQWHKKNPTTNNAQRNEKPICKRLGFQHHGEKLVTTVASCPPFLHQCLFTHASTHLLIWLAIHPYVWLSIRSHTVWCSCLLTSAQPVYSLKRPVSYCYDKFTWEHLWFTMLLAHTFLHFKWGWLFYKEGYCWCCCYLSNCWSRKDVNYNIPFSHAALDRPMIFFSFTVQAHNI